MRIKHATGDKSRKGETVADLLHQLSCRPKSWRGDVLADKVVDDRSENDVDLQLDGKNAIYQPNAT